MAATEPWFIGERAEALATMYLTRRQDLEVSPATVHSQGTGYDLRIQLRNENGGVPIDFVVKVKGIFRSSLPSVRSSHGIFPVRYALRELEYRGVPVCIFLFTVDDEQGYYRWLYEPIITTQEDGVLQLDQNLESISSEDRERQQVVTLSKFEKLDNNAIDKVVHQVAAWYKVARVPVRLLHAAR